jgi:hypothetical protein
VPEYRGGYADWLLAELERNGIPLPDSRDTVRQRTNDYTHDLQTREGAFGEPEVIDDMMTKAGFVIISREQIDMPLNTSFKNFVAKLSKRRFLSVAQSPMR